MGIDFIKHGGAVSKSGSHKINPNLSFFEAMSRNFETNQ